MIKQTVVRTYPPAVGYIADSKSTEDLRAYLNKGYRVMMVNKISNKTGEWLEYIVEKETPMTDTYLCLDCIFDEFCTVWIPNCPRFQKEESDAKSDISNNRGDSGDVVVHDGRDGCNGGL